MTTDVRRCQTNRKHCLVGKQGNDLKKGLLELSSGGQGQSQLNPSRFAARITILAMTDPKSPSESSNAAGAHKASSAKLSASPATANQPETSDTSDETSSSTFLASLSPSPRPNLSNTVSGVSSSTMSVPEVVRPHILAFNFVYNTLTTTEHRSRSIRY
jgi:hypothetical protein